MTYPDFHLLQAKESQFQPQFLGVYYGGKIKVAKIYYIDIFVYIYKILIFRKKFHPNVFHAFPKSICLKEAVRWIALLPATIPAAYTRK